MLNISKENQQQYEKMKPTNKIKNKKMLIETTYVTNSKKFLILKMPYQIIG